MPPIDSKIQGAWGACHASRFSPHSSLLKVIPNILNKKEYISVISSITFDVGFPPPWPAFVSTLKSMGLFPPSSA